MSAHGCGGLALLPLTRLAAAILVKPVAIDQVVHAIEQAVAGH